MTWIDGMSISFNLPSRLPLEALHHEAAAAGNSRATECVIAALSDSLGGSAGYDKILLRAAAGAGKSYALVRMVREALDHPNCTRVAVAAFANKQVFPLAAELGKLLGADRVCLFVAAQRIPDVPSETSAKVTVITQGSAIPNTCAVVLATSHKLGAMGEYSRLMTNLGVASNGNTPFDVLFVDEAWQLPLYLYSRIENLAPVSVGVGDVGQLPPIDPSQNPWRGDPGYNPYRAWPTQYENDAATYAIDLPAVWRPPAQQLPLWQAFYDDWDELNCVAAPLDRGVELPALNGFAESVWTSVASGRPTLLEVSGLAAPEAADIDRPLLGVIEGLLRQLLEAGFTTVARRYSDVGAPTDVIRVQSSSPTGDPLVAVLATRNQAVDDAADMVQRLKVELDLPEGVLIASTVDSWQGQTNAITVAIHPLSSAERLDDFNSSFGRLAVTCTRATHGLLVVARSGLDELLSDAPARPGTPLGEPGPRSLPRQTHQRILGTFCRGTLLLAGT